MEKQYRTYHVILYPDSTSYNCDDVLNICLSKYSEVAYILHNKDVWEDEILNDDGTVKYSKGELKKPHYHVIIHTSPRYPSAVVNALGISSNDVNYGSKVNFNASIRYLIHADNPNKYHYDVSEIVSNISDLDRFFTVVDEGLQVMNLIELREKGASYKELCQYACSHNCWDSLRRDIHLIELCSNEQNIIKKVVNKAYFEAYQNCKEQICQDLVSVGDYSLANYEQ